MTHQPRPLAPSALKELRVRDDAGRPMSPYVDEEGGAPLRCCLRRSAVGDRIALVSYAPLRRWAAETGAEPGAYDEQGPVFVHAEDCGGPDPDGTGYPWARPGVLRTVRRYDSEGHILGGHLVELPDDADAALDHALTGAFADPDTAQVHVRDVEYGCYLFRVDRP
ncbi:DUF1203 domain-containing protein [Streptomyces sp. NBC_01498]|uniref:DUF1203 domain-containing protein n=1 Tax=Streptomyces sp. NBC_01498 TaxID=2975870 RepID=UPI002E7C0EA2|nr:DUF1203 domain-containing protein [Streptomyces sp. NBC_01498]WTL28798.1 DUF1203 domain-containing protein [Streptomyces sp. NBC_01498]